MLLLSIAWKRQSNYAQLTGASAEERGIENNPDFTGSLIQGQDEEWDLKIPRILRIP